MGYAPQMRTVKPPRSVAIGVGSLGTATAAFITSALLAMTALSWDAAFYFASPDTVRLVELCGGAVVALASWSAAVAIVSERARKAARTGAWALLLLGS